ncbi:hypothetical protein HF086_006419 [Spodoptera exigua]|uniref:Uncharacterized protein n=1 Tax=Spodoptera exigua TaxID=7107 RepID=A0A922MXA8_SPOEX|nr:hypothetical protein HF086_006419 [Spodoptera exigua]
MLFCDSSHQGMDQLLTVTTNVVWTLKNLILEVVLCIEFEKFYIASQETQDICVNMLKGNCLSDEIQLYKNVRRLHQAKFNKMNVCGLFYVDAKLPRKMIALVANYTIVLLQFAFL